MHILHFRNGTTRQFEEAPVIDQLRQVVVVAHGEGVPFADLKAVFFLNDSRSDDASQAAQGAFLAVEFLDGEVIRGFARYSPEAPGFFLHPAEKGRNERVFVVTASVQSIEIEKV